MRIVKRLLLGVTLSLLWGLIPSPILATGTLQCVPYARELSGVRIHGDAWTWWDQAAGRYRRGTDPRPGAVLALANSDVMPLGHVAVVSKIIDERRILVRHANWSAPGLIERDVMAIDSSPENDWSQVRIWWGQSQQMGARNNPVDGFIYPDTPSERAVLDGQDSDAFDTRRIVDARPASPTRIFLMASARERVPSPRLAVDPTLFHAARDTMVSAGTAPRTLAMIIGDVQRGARLR